MTIKEIDEKLKKLCSSGKCSDGQILNLVIHRKVMDWFIGDSWDLVLKSKDGQKELFSISKKEIMDFIYKKWSKQLKK